MREERLRREARNQALFREVNEHIHELSSSGAWTVEGESTEVLCECGAEGCIQTMMLPLAEYERIRESPGNSFIVLPGHEHPEVDRVVERHDGWFVVESERRT